MNKNNVTFGGILHQNDDKSGYRIEHSCLYKSKGCKQGLHGFG